MCGREDMTIPLKIKYKNKACRSFLPIYVRLVSYLGMTHLWNFESYLHLLFVNSSHLARYRYATSKVIVRKHTVPLKTYILVY